MNTSAQDVDNLIFDAECGRVVLYLRGLTGLDSLFNQVEGHEKNSVTHAFLDRCKSGLSDKQIFDRIVREGARYVADDEANRVYNQAMLNYTKK